VDRDNETEEVFGARLLSQEDGRDEMNLAEFPLSGIANRFLDGRKTVVFSDKAWDTELKQHVDRELAISGSDRYGLPTAKDEDVLLACIQVSRLGEFQSPEVYFSRYELLKLLRWPDEGKYYQRLSTSLRRWKGVTVYSNRAFYDHARKSWVNRDFGVFDNLYIYEREASEGARAPASSRLVWNEVLFSNFQAGYLKRLDWGLYCRLTDPVAKRLYRLLDKRFYHGDEVTFDLQDLAFRKVRLSDKYDTAQIKRALAGGIRELEALWELRRVPLAKRFTKKERGKWEVTFQRQKPKKLQAKLERAEAECSDLAMELVRRGIGPSMAEELVAKHEAAGIKTMIELFDWYQTRGQEKGAGFLVDSIRRRPEYRLPPGFESQATKRERQAAAHSRKRAVRKKQQLKEQAEEAAAKSRLEPFLEFWRGLDETARTEFEIQALTAAAPLKREGYHRLQQSGGHTFEQYRQVILRDYFEQQPDWSEREG
jgi:hypothetical protein